MTTRSTVFRAACAVAVLALSVPAVQAGTYAELVQSHTPVAYWRLGETAGTTAADVMSAYPGTYVGPTLNQTSFGQGANKAPLFDGVNDYVNVGAPNVSGSEITIVAWVKGNAFNSSGTRILSKKKIWTILFVVSNTTAMTVGESARYNLMQSSGFAWKINLIGQTASQAAFNAAVAEVDVVYVSEGVDSAQIGTKLRNVTIGVVNEEFNLADEFGLATAGGSTSKSTISIQTNGHYITQFFPIGNLQITNIDQPLTYLDSGYAAGLNQLAHVSTVGIHTRPALSTLNQGGAIVGGGTAAGRRVQLPWGTAAFDIGQLNSNGQLIAIRSFDWAAGRTDSTAETNRHHWTLGTETVSGNVYPQFILKAGGTTTTLTASSGALAVGEWAFLTAVYNGSTMRLYKNGVQIASVSKTGALDDGANAPAWIGAQPESAAANSSSRPFNGMIDEVAIFNRAITPADIALLYRRGAAKGIIIKSWTETQ